MFYPSEASHKRLKASLFLGGFWFLNLTWNPGIRLHLHNEFGWKCHRSMHWALNHWR